MQQHNGQIERRRGLARLARDTGGNTLAMMAAAMVPVAALAGSAIDTARLYVVKVRLQQACDAGVLAGRKFMVSSNAKTLDATAKTQAKSFFTNNFRSGWMQTKAQDFTPTKTADQQVSATATATVPMTIMKMFAAPDVKLDVVCEARFDVADADIMLVLDTTGSMACAANEPGGCTQPTATYNRPDGTGLGYFATEKGTSKIRALRAAVLNFHDTLTTNADPTTNLRYGFVSYTSTVNAGFAVRNLSPNNIVDDWDYQSRRVVADENYGSTTDTSFKNISQNDCNAKAVRTPATALTYTTTGTATLARVKSWTANGGGNAAVGECIITTQPKKPMWRYEQVNYDTSRFKMGDAVLDRSKVTGATSRWQGCLEERETTATATFNAASLPADLDPDLPATDVDTRWRPMWPDLIYFRGNNTSVDFSGSSTIVYGDYHYPDAANVAQTYTNIIATARGTATPWDDNIRGGFVSCGKPVVRLRTMTRDDVEDYVDAVDFVPQGGTYHDVGMIWGLRLISPTGLFAADTAAWPGRNAPNRYIIFMTDGDMAPNACLYGMYGMENYDRRVTGTTYQSDCIADNAVARHNARFLAECEAARARNIRVFVIAFGQTLTPQLTACASPGQAYSAGDAPALEKAFGDIAKQIAMLRVSL